MNFEDGKNSHAQQRALAWSVETLHKWECSNTAWTRRVIEYGSIEPVFSSHRVSRKCLMIMQLPSQARHTAATSGMCMIWMMMVFVFAYLTYKYCSAKNSVTYTFIKCKSMPLRVRKRVYFISKFLPQANGRKANIRWRRRKTVDIGFICHDSIHERISWHTQKHIVCIIPMCCPQKEVDAVMMLKKNCTNHTYNTIQA